MELFAATPEWDNQLGFDEKAEVFGNALPRHIEVAAELIEGLAVMLVKLV